MRHRLVRTLTASLAGVSALVLVANAGLSTPPETDVRASVKADQARALSDSGALLRLERIDRADRSFRPTTTIIAAPTTTVTTARKVLPSTSLPVSRPTGTVAKPEGCGTGKAYWRCATAVSASGEVRPTEQFRRVGWCETRGERDPWHAPNRAGSTASGYWQIINPTWNGFGGYSRALFAPADVQEAKARELWADGKGGGHWQSTRWCWG